VYTDGSYLPEKPEGAPGIGAAVYVPGSEPIPVACEWTGEGADPTSCNTISRAELAAIDVSVNQQWEAGQRRDGSLHIATDSLGSIYGISKMLNRPQDVREHRHLALLKSIAHGIQEAPGTLHLWKVTSHTGQVGNETADRTAVAVATGEAEAALQCETPSNNRSAMNWAYHKKSEQDSQGKPFTTLAPLQTC